MVSGWEISETPAYKASIETLGGARNCDEALAPILFALNRNPLGFATITGISSDIRIAKTKLKIIGNVILPAMRLWFRVELAARHVHLLYVEACPPSQMAYSSNLWGDDDES